MSKKLPAVVQRRKREEDEKSVRVIVTPGMPMPGFAQPPVSSPTLSPSHTLHATLPEAALLPEGINGQSPAYQEQARSGTALSSARIRVEQQGRITAEIPLNQPLFTIGRHSSCNVRVINQRVSRLHARLYQDMGAWVVEDAGSVNGIAYQGQRVQRIVLKHGDRVYLAPDAVLIFEYQ